MMYAFCILHNMILKDEGKTISPVPICYPPMHENNYEDINRRMKDPNTLHQFGYNIVEHINLRQEQQSANYINLNNV